MLKHCYCTAAMLVGALVGANAPLEWRADATRVARTAALTQQATAFDLTLVYRPFLRED